MVVLGGFIRRYSPKFGVEFTLLAGTLREIKSATAPVSEPKSKGLECEFGNNSFSKLVEDLENYECVIRCCVPKKFLVYGAAFGANSRWELNEKIDFNLKKLLHKKMELIHKIILDYRVLLTFIRDLFVVDPGPGFFDMHKFEQINTLTSDGADIESSINLPGVAHDYMRSICRGSR
ncbi:PREDICTED: uncharacterized protein LOC105971443 isoform X2 [Erythranthe guttata]|nr:PREDICTED: uncharacterized protein LOC105971443 isoform X2 [Erythranthe guttata]|eukprot:XP_012851751.1 PREDICTED: uncharacterized protein LOC105971443 isoform X2 [Erythranthe guttata]